MRIRVTPLLVTLAVCVLPRTAAAVCLLNDYSVRAEYDRSAAVVTGHVISERSVGESGGYYEGVVYIVNVDVVYHGNMSGRIEIFSENSSGRFPMQRHERYVLFVYSETGRLMVDNCGNSGPLPEKADVLRALKDIATPKRGGQNPNSPLHADAAFGRAGERDR